MKFTIKDLSLNALAGALYVALGFAFNFLSFELVQFRIAEFLLILLLFNPKFAPGLIIGTFAFNLTSPFGILDALVGTLASLVAIILMIVTRKIPLISLIFPAVANGIIVGTMISSINQIPFFATFGFVFLGELVVMYVIGLPLYYYFKKNEYILELIS